MNSIQLERRVRAVLPKSCNFLGVFARDEPPVIGARLTRFPVCWIANTDIARSSGIHWVAFYCASQASYLEFFDSFALSPAYYSIPLQSRFRGLISVNHSQLQSDSSDVCGLWCLYFIVMRAQCRFNTSNFSRSDYNFNDRLLRRIINRKFRVRKK